MVPSKPDLCHQAGTTPTRCLPSVRPGGTIVACGQPSAGCPLAADGGREGMPEAKRNLPALIFALDAKESATCC
jgi:hypothetical protein